MALAAALLTALLTIAATARSRVLDQITKGGPLAGITVDGPRLDQDELRRIERVPGVVSVLPVVSVQQLVIAPDPPVFGSGQLSGPASAPPFVDGAVGVDLSRADRFPISLIAGRLPSPDSMTEVAVTEGYLERVGLDRARAVKVLGTELELGTPSYTISSRPGVVGPSGAFGRWTRATVVGVVAQDAGPGNLLVPILIIHGEADKLVPIQQADAAWAFAQGGPPHFAALMVEARTLANVSAVRERIGELGFATIASETLLTNVVRYVHVVEIVLSGIGLIALVIAALGIGNAMLAAVRERRREIGVLKAIGARDRDILRVFWMEAAFVGLIGGAAGTLGGWGAAKVVSAVVNRYLTSQGLAGAPVIFPLALAIGGVVGSMLLAVAAGALPALHASRLPAVEAMGGA